MWFAYVMRSLRDGGFYIGMSSDLERRVGEHNAGYSQATRSRGPFELFYVERCETRVEARVREKFLKSGIGREFLGIAALREQFRNKAGVTQR